MKYKPLLFFLLSLKMAAFATNDCTCQNIRPSCETFVCIEGAGLEKTRNYLDLSFDLIYWQAKQGPFFDLATFDSNGTLQYVFPENPLRWGFKLAAGVYLNAIDADLLTKYTFFYNKQQLGKYQFITTPSDVGNNFSKLGNYYGNYFNQLFFLINRGFSAGPFFCFSSAGGVFLGWDDQWFSDKGIYTDGTSATTFNHQKWWGIGPYGCVESAFIFPEFPTPYCKKAQMDLFFQMGGALAWSEINPSFYYVDNSYRVANCWDLGTLLEMNLGVRFDGVFGSEEKAVKFGGKIAWETQFWPSHIYNLEGLTPLDFQMQGLTFGLNIRY